MKLYRIMNNKELYNVIPRIWQWMLKNYLKDDFKQKQRGSTEELGSFKENGRKKIIYN